MEEDIYKSIKEGKKSHNSNNNNKENEEGEGYEKNKIKVLSVFLECLFFRSCETFTHLKILYERYSALLKKLFIDHTVLFQQILVDTLLYFWQNS